MMSWEEKGICVTMWLFSVEGRIYLTVYWPNYWLGIHDGFLRDRLRTFDGAVWVWTFVCAENPVCCRKVPNEI